MENICAICHADPSSHSFSKMYKTDNTTVFYTCPANATKYYDTAGIINHYDAMLRENGDGQWIWVFDSKGFGIKHMLELNTGIEIAKLITQKYSKTLKKIKVINPTWYIFMAYNTIKFFLSEELSSIIDFD